MMIILLVISSNPLTMYAFPQPVGGLMPYIREARSFKVEVRETSVTISVIGPISEEFAVIIDNNGGVHSIRVAQINYTAEGGAFIWDNAWQQLYGSDSISKPIVEEKPNCVEITTFALYRIHPVKIVTKMTISKNGVIIVDMNATAVEDADKILRIGWGFWGFPVSLFGGRYAEVCREGTIVKVELPLEYNSAYTRFYDTNRMTYWMDFSTISEGITMINIAPSLTTAFGIGDNRGNTDPPPSPTFYAHFSFTEWQKSGMKKGEVRRGRMALYIHGPGGYEENKDMVNLILDVGRVEDAAINAISSSTNPSDRNLAQEALLYAHSAYEKIFEGDIEGARKLLEEASHLVRKTGGADSAKPIVSILILIVVAACILAIYYLKRRRIAFSFKSSTTIT
ncbi:MAG: hypothetical protein QXT26_00485 [Thermoproteota archaeon]